MEEKIARAAPAINVARISFIEIPAGVRVTPAGFTFECREQFRGWRDCSRLSRDPRPTIVLYNLGFNAHRIFTSGSSLRMRIRANLGDTGVRTHALGPKAAEEGVSVV